MSPTSVTSVAHCVAFYATLLSSIELHCCRLIGDINGAKFDDISVAKLATLMSAAGDTFVSFYCIEQQRYMSFLFAEYRRNQCFLQYGYTHRRSLIFRLACYKEMSTGEGAKSSKILSFFGLKMVYANAFFDA